MRLFSLEGVRAFRRDHVSLKEIAEAESSSSKVMKVNLDRRGVVPLAPKFELGRVWYRKADLEIV